MPARLRPERRRGTRGLSAGPTAIGDSAVADPLDQVGEVARGVRPADRQRPRGGIVERHRVRRHRLDLARQHLGREVRLLDRPRAAGLGHLARIGGLVIVGRGGERE